jgi:hypothetical protein
MDTLRYIIQELPDDPSKLINQSFNPKDIITGGNKSLIHHAFDEEEDVFSTDWYYNY